MFHLLVNKSDQRLWQNNQRIPLSGLNQQLMLYVPINDNSTASTRHTEVVCTDKW